MTIQDRLIAGDTLDFTDQVAEYPATDGWTLRYRLIPRFTTPVQAPITLTATAVGADYRVQAGSTTTASWATGDYSWGRWVEQIGMRQSLGSGVIYIAPDLATTAQGHDARTHVQKVLDAIEAVLEGRASMDQEQYEIDGRSLKRTPIADLLVLRSQYRTELLNEKQKERVAAGLSDQRNIRVRFTRV